MDDRVNDASEQEERLDEIVTAYLKAQEAGQVTDRQALLDSNPDLATDLREFFAVQDRLEKLAAPLHILLGVLGDFRILREVGKGGMGIVYEAEQISLRRRVALKVLPFAATMDPRHLQRFHNEARAAACLDHPHIVRVHSVGCERGVHYFAMKFIEGQSLAELIAAQRHSALSGRRQPPERSLGERTPPAQETQPIVAATTQAAPRDAAYYRRIAEWGMQAAEALEHAHSLGIVHRDVKPANVMIDAQGILWITDFGLARTATDAGLTMTGDVLGTLRYMSPEQALAKHGLVDHRTDVYSLGATLHELLTLEPPFTGRDRQELLNQIAFEEPRSPRRLNRAVPLELDTIVLKAIAKEPADRYAAAQELADDLRRYLEHRPIRARRPALMDRLAKWGRRHRSLVLAGVVFLVLAVAGLAAGVVLIAQEQAETAKARDLAIEREQSLRHILYTQDIGLAWQALREGERERMRVLLDRHIPEDGQEDLRGFAWWHLQRRSRGVLHEIARVVAHEGDAYCVRYSPDGRALASAGKDGVIRFWDARTLRPRGELRSGQGEVNEVVFSPDGKSLASAGDDRTVCLWDLASSRRRTILRPEGCRDELSALAISPDGKVLAAGGKDGQVWSWDFASGALKAARDPGAGQVRYLTFSPDGRYLATATTSSRVLLLDPATLRERERFHHHSGSVESVSFSRDGKTLAAGSANRIFQWDLAQRAHIDLSVHDGLFIRSLSFSLDDTLLVSGVDGGRVMLWDARAGSFRTSRQGHAERVWCTTFEPEGNRLATAGQDGIVKLWYVRGIDDCRTIRVAPERDKVDWLAFSPDGQILFTRTWNAKELGRWSAYSGLRAEPAEVPTSAILRPARASASRLATVVGDGRDLRVQDLAGAAVQVYRHRKLISAVAISSDGEHVAFADDSPAVWMWEVRPGQPRELMRLPGVCTRIAFAQNGETIAVAVAARVLILDPTQGQSLAVLSGHEKDVLALAFSPDGRLLATASPYDKTVRLWELSSRRERNCLWQLRAGVNAIAFSPDGKTLAGGTHAGEVILWDIAGGHELMRLDDHRGYILALAFSPDGKILAAGGHGPDGKSAEVTLWYADGTRQGQER